MDVMDWLGKLVIVLTVIGGIAKITQIIFSLAQKLMVAPIVTQFANFSAEIKALNATIENLRQTIVNMGERVAKIEASAKSAHHRIDTLEERVDAHIAQATEGK
jgi:predicted  nucleic acid-binding Zn-ribbon protein